MSKVKITHLLTSLWYEFNNRRKKQFSAVLFLMVITSFAEIVSIGAIFPFLAALMNPENLLKIDKLRWFLDIIGIRDPKDILLSLTAIFIVSALLACAMRLIQLKATLRLSFAAGADIGYRIYENTLYQPYQVHLSRNTSEVIDGITIKTSVVTDGIIMSCLYIASSLIMLLLLLGSLLFIAPLETLTTFILFGGFYTLVVVFTKRRQLSNSKIIARESVVVIKSLQEGLGGIRDVLLDGTQELYCNLYRKSDSLLRKAFASSSFIASSPRFIIEAAGVILLALLAYEASKIPDGISKAIPIIGVLALAAQRMLPIMQLSYAGWSNIRRNQYTLEDTLKLLSSNSNSVIYSNFNNANTIEFENSVVLKSIVFKFTQTGNTILDNVSLEIPKGSKIGIIGTTGSGKTTLLDIIMGLLPPSQGEIRVDNQLIGIHNIRAWQRQIAHVPQHIFLTDATIAENIAFGVPLQEIDKNRLFQAIDCAMLMETIQSFPDGINTNVGERGVKLSGGQRQRIGIARALYKNASILILDEATSALDSDTEKSIMRAINNLNEDITMFMIAHRITTLEGCDRIICLENGMISGTYDYSEIIKSENT